MVNLDIGSVLSFVCLASTNYHGRLLYATLGPMVVLAALASVFAVAKRRNRDSEEAVCVVRRKHLSIAIFILFLVYSSASQTIFQAFACDRLDDGTSYLIADYSLNCETTEHRIFMAYAAVMIAVYPLGIPAFFSWWLLNNREILVERLRHSGYSDEMMAFRDLWDPYKPRMFFYDIVEYVRRCTLTGVAVFIYPRSSAQVAIVLLLAVAFSLLCEMLSPFRRKTDRWLYRVGNWITVLSLYLALLLEVGIWTRESSNLMAFVAILISAHIGLIVAVIWLWLLWANKYRAAFHRRIGPPVRHVSVLRTCR